MFIGYFTERPYQDPNSGYFGATGRNLMDLGMSNSSYDPKLGADLYNRYLDEKIYAEEMGFDGLMLNEHHSTPFCMGGVMNLEAAILARITQRAKIVLLGNILPIWDDPLWLAEELAEIDMISRGRLVTGWVRGTGRESVAHNAAAPYNWERFQEAHDFIVDAWMRPGRSVGRASTTTTATSPLGTPVSGAAPADLDSGRDEPQHRRLGRTSSLPLPDAGDRAAAYRGVVPVLRPGGGGVRFHRRHGASGVPLQGACGRDRGTRRTSGTQVRPRPVKSPSSKAIRASFALHPEPAGANPAQQPLAHHESFAAAASRGRADQHLKNQQKDAPPPPPKDTYLDQTEKLSIISGTPDTVIPKVRHVLETIRPAPSSSGTATAPWTTTTPCAASA